MTTITFHMKDDRIQSFTCEGHSGYAEAGADIVCAAITSAVRLAECTITDVLGFSAKVRVNGQDARISLSLPADALEDEAAQAVLTGLMLTLCELRDENPEYIDVLEV